MSIEQLKQKQLDDEDIRVILQWKARGERPYGLEVSRTSPATRLYWHYWNSLEIHNGLLCRRYERHDHTGDYFQLILPAELKVMHQAHNSICGGHLGQKKTSQAVLRTG